MSTHCNCRTVSMLLMVGVFLSSASRSPAGLVLDDPLQQTSLGRRCGGEFIADGWRVIGKDDAIYWHVPAITHGAAEFDVRGLVPQEARPGMEDKTELFHMYDAAFGDADTTYLGGYRDNRFKQFLRKIGRADAGKADAMEILLQIKPNYVEPDTARLSWEPDATYHFRQEWGPDGQGNTVLKVYRNGVLLLTTSTPGLWNPAVHSVRIAASPRRSPDSGAPLGAVFSNIKVWDLSTGMPTAPVVVQPAGGATLNCPTVLVSWSGDRHARYEVRVTTGDDPNSDVVWRSGEVVCDRDFAWTGALPNPGVYHVFVRLGDAANWGPWSAAGRTFRVDSGFVPGSPNVVRVEGNVFCDNHGPFLGVGASYFQALRHAKYDRDRLDRNLAVLAANGFNYVRVLSMVNWDGLEIAPLSFRNRAGHSVAGWPDYWQQFRDLLDRVALHGMRTEMTIFADAQYVMPDKAARVAHLDGILANIAGREHLILHLEVANEAWQNGFPGSQGVADLREFTQYLADRTSVPVAITSNDDPSDAGIATVYSGSAADLATVHFSRDIRTVEGGWLPVRDSWRSLGRSGVPPLVSNEPIGPGSSVNSESDPIKLCAAAVFGYIANLPGYVYHSRTGVYANTVCCPPSGDEMDFHDTVGVDAYRHLRQLLPGDLAGWVRNDGIEPSAPFTVFCGGRGDRYWPDVAGATDGCLRNIGSVKGREFVCFPMGIRSGGLSLEARQPVQFQVFHPLTGQAVSDSTLDAQGRITLPQGPGAWIMRGRLSPAH